MAVSLADIKKLREMTSAGMMDCKNALTEALGEELTRVSGFEADWRGIDLTENKPLPSAALVTEGYMLCVIKHLRMRYRWLILST